MPRNILRILTFAAFWIANIMLVMGVIGSNIGLGILGIMLGLFIATPAMMAWFSLDRAALDGFTSSFFPQMKGIVGLAERGRAMVTGQSVTNPDVEIPNPVLEAEDDDDSIIIDVRLADKEESTSQTSQSEPVAKSSPPRKQSNEVYSVPIVVESELARDLPAVEENDFEHLKQPEASEEDTPAEEKPKEPSEWEKEKQQEDEYKRLRNEIETMDETHYQDLLQYADHQDARVRLAVVQRLRHLDRDKSFEHLQNALDDQDAIVQRAARIAINEMEEDQS